MEGLRSRHAVKSCYRHQPQFWRNVVASSKVGVQACDRYCGATEGADNYFFTCDECKIV
jgi:hypothetical protein